MVDSDGDWRYNKGRKVESLPQVARPTDMNGTCRHVVAATWRRFLFVLLNQNDNQGQNGKDDHEKLIIAHYAHPLFFGESGAKRRERAARLAVEDSAQALRRPRTRAPHLCVGAGEATPCRNLPADMIVTDYGLKSNETQRNRPSRTRRAICVFLAE